MKAIIYTAIGAQEPTVELIPPDQNEPVRCACPCGLKSHEKAFCEEDYVKAGEVFAGWLWQSVPGGFTTGVRRELNRLSNHSI